MTRDAGITRLTVLLSTLVCLTQARVAGRHSISGNTRVTPTAQGNGDILFEFDHLSHESGLERRYNSSWGANCRDLIIPVTATKTIEENFSMDDYRLDILFALGERNVLIDAEYELSATFCEPSSGIKRKDTLQILAHGATFNKIMWDFPYQPDTYSWTRFMTNSGYSTLAIDLVGAGNSSHPQGLLEAQTATYVQTTHYVIAKVRSGEILNKIFSKVVLVGFSIGGITANSLAATYPDDADMLVLLGISWDLPYIYPSFLSGLQSAANEIDPQKWGHLEAFYQTQPSLAAREAANFNGDYDVEVLKMDFETRDLDTMGAAITFTFHLVEAPAYDKPVFLGIGGVDATFCGRECGSQPYALYDRFPAASEHIIKVYPKTGHALLYHRAAPQVMADAREFLDRHTA